MEYNVLRLGVVQEFINQKFNSSSSAPLAQNRCYLPFFLQSVKFYFKTIIKNDL